MALLRSPFRGRAYIVTQIYAAWMPVIVTQNGITTRGRSFPRSAFSCEVDYLFKLTGYLINVAKGKAPRGPKICVASTLRLAVDGDTRSEIYIKLLYMIPVLYILFDNISFVLYHIVIFSY